MPKNLLNLFKKDPIPTEGDVAPKKITEKTIIEANKTLNKYKSGKSTFEQKIIANEEYWKMRQWDRGVGGAVVKNGKNEYNVPSTPWLHSCIESRHADAMDSYPTCNVRPRQKDDEPEAKKLSAILPVIFEQNDFEKTYSEVERYVLKNGGGAYGVFWNPTAHGGLGDVAIKKIDLLSLFWEPGVTDLQDSANVFYTSLVDNKALIQRYPQLENKLGGKNIATARYLYDDSIPTDDKSVVVDWYYRVYRGGQKFLHLCKYVNDVVLFASENDPAYENGYYEDGDYPFVERSLYPVEGSPFGQGLTDVGRGTQLQIDLLSKAIVDNSVEGARPRYFGKSASQINEDEFNDPTQRIVHVEGSVDEANLRQIVTADLPGIYVTAMNNKIEELKYCTANQDVNNGVAPSSVVSAAGIAALQESSGKNARNSNRSAHRDYKKLVYMVIERIRQFYDMPRVFRIASDSINDQYIEYTNAGLKPQMQTLGGKQNGFRKPEFDIEVTVERDNPYKKIERNEMMMQFYNMGLFLPQNTDQALALLGHMDFDGREEMMAQIRENGTMLQMMLQYQQIALQLAQATDPALAQQLAQTIIASDSGMVANTGLSLGGVSVDLSAGEKEHPFVERSRGQARASTEVN